MTNRSPIKHPRRREPLPPMVRQWLKEIREVRTPHRLANSLAMIGMEFDGVPADTMPESESILAYPVRCSEKYRRVVLDRLDRVLLRGALNIVRHESYLMRNGKAGRIFTGLDYVNGLTKAIEESLRRVP